MAGVGRVLLHHFNTQGTPVMIGEREEGREGGGEGGWVGGGYREEDGGRKEDEAFKLYKLNIGVAA